MQLYHEAMGGGGGGCSRHLSSCGLGATKRYQATWYTSKTAWLALTNRMIMRWAEFMKTLRQLLVGVALMKSISHSRLFAVWYFALLNARSLFSIITVNILSSRARVMLGGLFLI